MVQALRKDGARGTPHQYTAANNLGRPQPKLVVDNSTQIETRATAGRNKKVSKIASHRAENIQNQRGSIEEAEDLTREQNRQRVRNALRHRSILRIAKAGGGKAKIKRTKELIRAADTFGIILYPAIFQMIFGLLAFASLAVEETWWGWVVPGIYMTGVCWLLALLIGSYTMVIAGGILHTHFKDWRVVTAFFFCFSANCAPILQIIPWVNVWILITILQKE